MDKKKVLNIDLDELCEAMESSSYEHEHYLNLETGEILFISEYMDDRESKKLRRQIEKNRECYELVPRAESRQGYEDMVDFIATLADNHLVDLLVVAISGRGAFRRFKDVLLNYPAERERWFRFKNDLARQRVLEWLEDIDVELPGE